MSELHDRAGREHPLVDLARRQLAERKSDRRDFLRTATLLGVSAGAAYAMAGEILGEAVVAPAAAQAGEPQSGGILRVSMAVQEMADPALFDWNEKSNQARHIVEYLTYTDPENITRPYLAERWEVSDDLKVWTFHLRQGVKWNNGDAFTADDVLFNVKRWLDPQTGSSNIGLFAGLTESFDTGEKNADGSAKMGQRERAGAVERVDDHTVRLTFNRAVLSVPENFYNYPTAILHRDFAKNGGDLSKNPVGTGPYTLAEFAVGQRCILKRTEMPYWGKDLEDPYMFGPIYLAEIHYYDHGPASAAQLAAFASGQVDAIYEYDIASFAIASSIPNAKTYEAQTAQTGCLRFKVTEAPFTDQRVRRAIQLACDPSTYNELVYQGKGTVGEHHHVSPVHPEYFPLPPLRQDVEGAKRLLAEAGHPDGIEITIDCGNTNGPWQQQVCEVLREQLAPAGITLNINLMPAEQYWANWTKTPFGITAWTHRPLGTMVLSVAYRTGVPWNESGYSSKEFEDALDEAEGLIDAEQRKAAMEKVEKILQDSAVMIQPIWQPKFFLASQSVQAMHAHPTQYHQYHKVWMAA